MGSACSTHKSIKNVEEPQRISNEKPRKVIKSGSLRNGQQEEEAKPKESSPIQTEKTENMSNLEKKSYNTPKSKYEKRDELLASQWESYLFSSSVNKYELDGDHYFEIKNPYPDCFFLDIEDDIDIEKIVYVLVRGYPTVVATMIQQVDEGNDLAILTSIQIPTILESDKIMFPILQTLVESLPGKFEKPSMITYEKRNYFIDSNEEFNKMMEITDNTLATIEENKPISLDFKGSVYMNTCIGLPLLHYAVSLDNLNAVETLLKLGAKTSQRDTNSNTALFYVKSVEMFRKLANCLDSEKDLFRPNTEERLLSHQFCSLYDENRTLCKQLIEELTSLIKKASNPHESLLKLFWSLDNQNSTALQILDKQIKRYVSNLPEEEKVKLVSEELKWQLGLNLVKPNSFNVVEDRFGLTPLEMAVIEENIPLIHEFGSKGKAEDCRPFVLNHVRSVHVAKMLHRFYPLLFEKKDFSDVSAPSPLSSVIRNMREGNVPLISFMVETFNYRLSIVEINQLIELVLSSSSEKLLEILEKVISKSSNLFSQVLKKNNSFSKRNAFNPNNFEQSPLEYILSIHSDMKNASTLQQLIWNRVKELCSEEKYRILLKQQCGYIIKECLLMRKFDNFKEILEFLKDIGVNRDDLRYQFESNFRSLRQIDMIYNALSSLLHSHNNLTNILTEDFFNSVAQLASDDGSDAPILHILFCLYLKKADLKVVTKLLETGYSTQTLDGPLTLVDDDMRSWLKNWVSGLHDSHFLKKYLLRPYGNDEKRSDKQKERNTAFKLELSNVRRYILLNLIDRSSIHETISDQNFDTPIAFKIVDEAAKCIKEVDHTDELERAMFFDTVTFNLNVLYERVDKDGDFSMREQILKEIGMLKECLGLSNPDFTIFNDHSSVSSEKLLEILGKVNYKSSNLFCQVLKKNNSFSKRNAFNPNHSDIKNASTLQQLIWNRVKELRSEEYRILLKQQCGYIIKECLLMRKFDNFKEILEFLKDIGVNHEDLRHESNFRGLRQIDMIYNALSSLLHSHDFLTNILTEDFFNSVAQLASDDGSDAPILHILFCLYLKKADLKVVTKLLETGYSTQTLDGPLTLVDDDMRSWLKNWVSGMNDSHFLKKYLLRPYGNDEKRSDKQKERNTAFKLELSNIRKYILLNLIDRNNIHETISDQNFDTPIAFKIVDEAAKCIKEVDHTDELERAMFFDTVTFNLNVLYERVDKDGDFWMREQILIEIGMLKECLGLSNPDFTIFNDHSSVLQAFEKYYKLNKKNLSIENFIPLFLKADFKSVLHFCLSHQCLHMLTPELLTNITPAQQLKVSRFFYMFGTHNEKNRKDVDELLEWINSSSPKQPHLLSLLKNAISVGNVKCTKNLISSFMKNSFQLTIDDISPITESILSVFRGGCDKLLSSLICEFLSLDQILSLKSESNETTLHSICYGGCSESLHLIYSSLDSKEFSKMFLDTSYKAGSVMVQEEEDEEEFYKEEPIVYPTHYLAYLSGKLVIRKQCLSILREISSKGLLGSLSLAGDWTNQIGSLNMIINFNQENNDIPLLNITSKPFSIYSLTISYWVKYYIDNSESFRFDDRFIKFFIYHLVSQRYITPEIDEVDNDMLTSCFSYNTLPRNLWTRFFESLIDTSANDKKIYFLAAIQKPSLLDEDSIVRLLNLYYKSIKTNDSSDVVEKELLEIFLLGEEIEKNLITMAALLNRTKLMKIISTIIEENPGLKFKILESKKPLIEKLSSLMHPTLENKATKDCLLFFDIEQSQYASKTQELTFEYETSRISKNISDDLIIAHSIGKTIRNWTMDKAVDQFIEHLKEETGVMFTVSFFPSLDILTTPIPQIMTGTTCISSIVANIKPLLEKGLPINSLHLVMNAKQQEFFSSINEHSVEIKLSISKEENNTLIVAPFKD